ncbi:MAG: hypothetical protein ABJA85_00370 [Bacteroidota bacterium]
MKSNIQPSFYFSPHSLKALKPEPTAQQLSQSPYLRAVLSGKTRSANHSQTANSNMVAALRYIARSR